MQSTEQPRREDPPPARTRRPRQTSRRVVWIDRIARSTITIGGSAVILAVLGILVYLVWVVWPLFLGARVDGRHSYALIEPSRVPDVLLAEVDEYRALGFWLTRDGLLATFAARTGQELSRAALFDTVSGAALTASSRRPGSGQVAFGFEDGTTRLGAIRFDTGFVDETTWDGELPAKTPGALIASADGILERTPGGELRRTTIIGTLEESVLLGTPGVPIVLLDAHDRGSDARIAVLQADRGLFVNEVSRRTNLLTGEVRRELRSTPLPFPADLDELGQPSFLQLSSQGDQLYLAWRDGTVARYDLRDRDAPIVAERADLVPESTATLDTFGFMLGEQSLLSGDSLGRIRVWFRVPREGANRDGYTLVPAHTLSPADGGVTALAISARDKSLVSGSTAGGVALHHMTSEQLLAEVHLEPAAPVVSVQLSPKSDGLFVLGADGRATVWNVHNPHPETTLSSIFSKVWYEGYAEPSYTWQSSSGTDDFEPKFSLIPLIFGTLKATLYSLLFAVPIALSGAIYTSEFLDRRYRAGVKATIETMASLPSVVLGFIAALVLAPLIENWVVATLTVFAVVPVAALGFGYLWQALPTRVTLPLAGRRQFVILLLVILAAVASAFRLGGLLESWLFWGDFKAWLDGRVGDGTPGVAVLVWPPLLVVLMLVDRRWIAGSVERRLGAMPRHIGASFEVIKYLLIILFSLVLAWLAALIVTAWGFDPRGVLVGTYVQRNAMIVGFVMGFAVIPIIYTIAEDALAAVPESLRSASLGCGATRWQTATRVVLPVALSGIFSALMIGLGRAVGETMIVLMAAGNTPLLDLNIFNGLRTLSANIAVELPEAVKDGTLYRMLFLAALTLFVLTSIVNTVAEIIRQRFRRRAFQL